MLTYQLMKFNELYFIGGIEHCSNAWEIDTIF